MSAAPGLNHTAWLKKPCPKCNSRLFLNQDESGMYENCICCGYTHDIENPNSPKLKLHLDDLNKDRTH